MAIEKVNPGDVKSGFPATTYNKIADIANAFDLGKLTLNRKSFDVVRSACVIEVLNDGAGSRSRLDVLGVKEPVILPSNDLEEFRNKLRVKGEVPTDDHEPHNFVVLLQPIDSGEIGYGVIAGATVAKVNVNDENHEFAGCEAGTVTHLESRESGGARILWKESGTGLKSAIIRFGASPSEVAIVRVSVAGCSDITEDSFCLWSGTVQEFDLGAATACDPWVNGADCWITIAGGCPSPNDTRRLKQGSRYRAILKGTYRDRPLYVIDLPGLVSVSHEDNPAYLYEQQADFVQTVGTIGDISTPSSGTAKLGDIKIVVQKTLDSLDEKLRYFESVSGFSANALQAMSHEIGSDEKSWLTPQTVTVITDLRVVGDVLEKRTATIKVFEVNDNGWVTAIQGTECP